LHIVPGTGSYGNAIFGLHLYTWAFIAFALMVIGCAVLLLDDRQFARPEPWSSRMNVLPLTAFVVFAVLAVGNVISTLLICGRGFCPDNPTQYLLFNGTPV
ncbi:MAG: disulfide bond formation protein B, partial [Pseudomonadota bacterium]